MHIAFRAAEEYVYVLRGKHKIVNAAICDLIIFPLGRRSLFSKCHVPGAGVQVISLKSVTKVRPSMLRFTLQSQAAKIMSANLSLNYTQIEKYSTRWFKYD